MGVSRRGFFVCLFVCKQISIWDLSGFKFESMLKNKLDTGDRYFERESELVYMRENRETTRVCECMCAYLCVLCENSSRATYRMCANMPTDLIRKHPQFSKTCAHF